MDASIRTKVKRKCKIRCYNLNFDTFNEIISFASRFEGPDEDKAIDHLLVGLDASRKSTIIGKETVQRSVSLLLEVTEATEESSDAVTAIRVVDAFLIPKYRYDCSRKQFYE